MSLSNSATFAVVTSIPCTFNSYPVSKHQLANSSLVDSPEACTPVEGEELEGLVSVPGSESDFQIKDIPIVTALDTGESETNNMLYIKPISPSVPPTQEFYTTYLTSACSSPDTSSMETACPPTTRDFDHMYASLSHVDTRALMAENVHLKEMLVTQLDLLQQQSDTILAKDKQLVKLREENGLLLQKLERMERRVRIDVPSNEKGTNNQGQRKRSRDRGDVEDKLFKKRKGSLLDKGAIPVIKDERGENDNVWPDQDLSDSVRDIESFDHRDDELTDEFIGDSEHLTHGPSGTAIESLRSATPTSAISEEIISKTDSATRKKSRKANEVSGKRQGGQKYFSPSLGERQQPGRNRKNKHLYSGSTSEPVTFLEAEELYFVGCKNDSISCLEDQLGEVPSLQRGVEVPSWREDKNHYSLLVPNKLSLKKSKDNKEAPTWRIKSTNPCYSMEGTEDISDNILLKRHEKMEKDEKQRKRWDLQRMRQEQQLQKLRARHEKQHSAQSKRDESISSLLPAVEVATHICVDEKIPVTAFGRPIPSLKRSTFSLPWLEDKKQ